MAARLRHSGLTLEPPGLARDRDGFQRTSNPSTLAVPGTEDGRGLSSLLVAQCKLAATSLSSEVHWKLSAQRGDGKGAVQGFS
jgi:hypothetical protein